MLYRGISSRLILGISVGHMNISRGKLEVLKRLLQHSKHKFHAADFNLIVATIIMEEESFISSRIMANATNLTGQKIAEQYGCLSSVQLHQAANEVRGNSSSRSSSKVGTRFPK